MLIGVSDLVSTQHIFVHSKIEQQYFKNSTTPAEAELGKVVLEGSGGPPYDAGARFWGSQAFPAGPGLQGFDFGQVGGGKAHF